MVIEVPVCSGDLLVQVMLKPSPYEAFILRTKYMKVVYIFNLVCVTTRYSASQKLFILESLRECPVQTHLLSSTAILCMAVEVYSHP